MSVVLLHMIYHISRLACLSAYSAGLGNVRPAGHMRPAKHLNVAREYFYADKILIMPLKMFFFKKMDF